MLTRVGLVVSLPVVLGERGRSDCGVEHDEAWKIRRVCEVGMIIISTGCVVVDGAHVVALNY